MSPEYSEFGGTQHRIRRLNSAIALTCPCNSMLRCKRKKDKSFVFRLVPSSDPGEARTLDPLIKSQLLYQLSYGVSNRRASPKNRCKYIKLLISFHVAHRIFCADFPTGDFSEFAGNSGPGQRRQVIKIQNALGMIVFVLDHPGGQATERPLTPDQCSVGVFDVDFPGTGYRTCEAGDAQTALVLVPGFVGPPGNDGIDKRLGNAVVFRVEVFGPLFGRQLVISAFAVDNEQCEGLINL